MKNISYRLLLGALMMLAASSLGAQQSVRQLSAASFIVNGRTRPVAGNPQRSARYFSLVNDRALSALGVSARLSLDHFPIAPDREGTLDLKRVRPAIDRSTELWMETAEGSRRMPVPEIIALRGSIHGEPESSVYMSYVDGLLFGSIRGGDGAVHVIAPATDGMVTGEHVIVAEGGIFSEGIPPAVECRAQEDATYYRLPGAPSGGRRMLAANTLLQADIAIEADYEFFKATGSDFVKSMAYASALFGMVSAIYEDEIDVTLHFSWFKVWGDSITDPYKVHGDAYALWDLVPPYWKEHYADVPRDLAHVLTSIGYGGGGKAFRGEAFSGGAAAICSRDYGYGMSSPTCAQSYPTFAFTYDAYIVAHELGHNFGARHTHDCWWNPALDTCFTRDDPKFSLDDACYATPITPRPNPGTIMSYCANTNYGLSGNDFSKYKLEMTFSPRVAEVLRSEAEATCLAEPTLPTVILKNPRGGRSIPASSPIELRWASAKVQNVALAYSLDGGERWEPIVSGVPSSEGRYPWTTPSSGSTKMLVRIFDVTDGSVADTSLMYIDLVSGADNDAESPVPAALDVAVDRAGVAHLRYVLAAPGPDVALRLYDAAGREVRTIGWLRSANAGEHTLEFSTADLPNGNYFIRLEAGRQTLTRGMSVTR